MTFQRESLFGEVTGREMVLNPWGRVVDQCWRAIQHHIPNVDLGAYVVMPNHVHGIIVMHEPDDRRGTIYRDPTENIEQYGKPVKGSIPTIVRTFKAAVTRQLGDEFGASHIWQRRFYDHVIRDDLDWTRIHNYIESNPMIWADDHENPKNQSHSG